MSVRVSKAYILFFLLFFIAVVADSGTEQSETRCQESRCGENGPPIRFPFRLKQDASPAYNSSCGYPGFDLFCVGDETVLDLPNRPSPPNKYLFVSEIDYQLQQISLYSPEKCRIDEQNRKLTTNLSTPPFEFIHDLSYTLFKCPSTHEMQFYTQDCQLNETSDHFVSALSANSDIQNYLFDYVSCSKMYDVPLGSYSVIELQLGDRSSAYPLLQWSEPDCRRCGTRGKGCRLKNRLGSRPDETECFDLVRSTKAPKKFPFVTVGASVGSVLLMVVLIAIIYFYTLDKNEQENRKRIEKFLEDYRAFNPSRYTYTDIKKITSQFKDVLGEGAFGTVFKGKLSNEIFVAVKILNNTFKGNGEEFINEVATMGRIHHVNVVRLVGFCANGFRRALVYEFLPNGSLEKYITSENRSLNWATSRDIALGIAKGIEYLHQGCDQRILHFDIKPYNVLLDQNFTPKISDFGMAKLYSNDQSIVSMTTARGTLGYIVPDVFSKNFRNVSYKPDVYSFGMFLLEMVGGRKNTINVTKEDSDSEQIYYPEWIYNLLEEGEDLRIGDEEEGDEKIAKKLAIVGL